MWNKTITITHLICYVIAPWLLIRTPSIIVGLTPYPRAQGLWKKIATVLQILSTSEHKDSPGTYKRPGKRGKPPVIQVVPVPSLPDDVLKGPIVGHPLLFLITVGMGVALTLSISGCGTANLADVYSATLISVERVNTSAIQSFEKFDASYQLNLVDRAEAEGHPERATSDLAAYREKRKPIILWQMRIASLVRSANALVPLVYRGLAKPTELDDILRQIVQVSATFQQVLEIFTVDVNRPLPPLPPTPSLPPTLPAPISHAAAPIKTL